MRKQKKENIWNVPNALTSSRVIITFLTMYFIFAGFNFAWIVAGFVIGMLTDFFDGQIARRFKLTTEFGRRFDMVADRILMFGVVGALVIDLGIKGVLDKFYGLQILMIMSREIIALPFAIISFVSGNVMVKVKFIGKMTTAMQGFSFPLIVINMFNPTYSFSIYFAAATCIVGFISGITYANDFYNSGGTK